MGSAVADTDRIQTTQAYARMSRKAILHRIATAECLEDRVYWAIILLSWCGPGVSDYAVVKDHRGFIQRDSAGLPVLATLRDIATALGLAPGMRGHISRSIASLSDKGAIQKIDGKLYPLKDPSVANTGNGALPCTGNGSLPRTVTRNVAGYVLPESYIPTDPALLQGFLEWTTQCQEKWRTELKTIKYGNQEEYVQGLSRFGIIIDRKAEEKKLASCSSLPEEEPYDEPAEPADPADPDEPWYPSAPPPDPPPVEAPPVEEPKVQPATTAEREEIRQMSARLGFPNVLAERLCDQIHENLKGAPLERLEAYAQANRRRMQGPGILPHFAQSAARDWELTQRIIESTQPLIDRHLNPEQPTDFLLAVAKDPTITADMREFAREQLRERGIELDE